jgi:mycothiol synthase
MGATGSVDKDGTTVGAMLPAGYRARDATLDDAPTLAQLRTAYEADEGSTTVVTAEEQLNDWQGVNLAEDTVLVFAPDGGLVGHADIFNRRYLQVSVYGGVRPDQRRRGIGTYLTRWGAAWAERHMDQAPTDAQITVQHYVNSRNEAAVALMAKLGYPYMHTIYVMRIKLDEPPPTPEQITGLRIRSFVPSQDERATFDAVDDAFRDIRGRIEGDFDRWLEFTANERQDPDLWFLAEDQQSGEIAGTCLGRAVPGAGGWIGGVGVRRPWRRRGLALAMLRTAFAAFFRRGVREVELSVDAGSPSNAPALYTRAGMQVAQNISLYRKELRPGKDYSTLPETPDAGE